MYIVNYWLYHYANLNKLNVDFTSGCDELCGVPVETMPSSSSSSSSSPITNTDSACEVL